MGDTPRVIVFVFAGRRANMALQVPLMHTILDENPNVEFHIWNLARVKSDGKYLQQLNPVERQHVYHQYFGLRPWRDNLGNVWRHYTDKQFKDCLFVKLDDDIVFLETARFGDYVEAIDANRGAVVSAQVVNNGACTRTEPGLWEKYAAKYGDKVPLLDVHRHQVFAETAHRYFFQNWQNMVDGPKQVVPCEDWLSINAVGFDHATLCEIVGRLGEPSPREISGRAFPASQLLGDEGSVNMSPRLIMRGFMVAHLGFGPQNINEQIFSRWRHLYSKINAQYLAAHRAVAV